jgi:hypothetical protein
MIHAIVHFAEGEVIEHHEGVPPWVFGVGTFAVLMLALFLVTRFDPDR